MNQTNTLIVGLSPKELSNDNFFEKLTSQVNDKIKTESVEFIKLPSLQRILIIFKTHLSSSIIYNLLKSQNYQLAFSVVDTKIPESTFLQLPDPGKKYVISPPPSPPIGWVDKPEDGPNLQVIHDPKELTDLLFKRLGERIGRYHHDDEEEEQNPIKNDIGHEEFINEQGQLEVPKVLLEKLQGNPIIVLDPPPNPANTDGKNSDGISVNRIKTPRPPPPSSD